MKMCDANWILALGATNF